MVNESGHKGVGGGNLAGCGYDLATILLVSMDSIFLATDSFGLKMRRCSSLMARHHQQHTRIALNAGTVRLRAPRVLCGSAVVVIVFRVRPESVARAGVTIPD